MIQVTEHQSLSERSDFYREWNAVARLSDLDRKHTYNGRRSAVEGERARLLDIRAARQGEVS